MSAKERKGVIKKSQSKEGKINRRWNKQKTIIKMIDLNTPY